MNAENDTLVAAYLAERDVACPFCGYQLRGIVRARCPECAMPLDVELLRDGTDASREREIQMEAADDWKRALAIVLSVAGIVLLLLVLARCGVIAL